MNNTVIAAVFAIVIMFVTGGYAIHVNKKDKKAKRLFAVVTIIGVILILLVPVFFPDIKL